MIKVSQKDLLHLAPLKNSQETFLSKTESFLLSRGHAIPNFSDKEKNKIKEYALSYWKENKHEHLAEAAWLYAYCAVLNIQLDLAVKR